MPLLSPVLDPILGIFTGILAYHLYERHPRTNLSPDKRLVNLIQWKWSRWTEEREGNHRNTGDGGLRR